MHTGIIFSMEEFGVNDGPGIRNVIFLKGCPLRCVWCHNPEGIAFEPQYMEKKNGRTLCGYPVDATELAGKIRKDKVLFDMGKGGVTLSGGEPLAQPRFVMEFLQQVAPIHRVIETSGYAPATVFREIVALTDLVLFDLKLMDEAKHKQYTGVNNGKILENLNYLCVSGKAFIIRILLIPEVNDNEANMLAVLNVDKLAHLVQMYIALGGRQLQLNTVSRDKLLDAKIHPEKHRNLMVRVWGWSGYFVELDECYHDHVINRIEFGV